MIEKDKFCIASCIWELLEDEGEANKGYSKFLSDNIEVLSKQHISQIKDIMSEESKHVNILMAMAEEITGIKPEK